MSAAETERTFEDSVVMVADLYQEAYGTHGAIEQLQAQRQPGRENNRINEILAVLKRRQGADK